MGRILPRRRMRDEFRFALWRWQDIHFDGRLYMTKLYLWRAPWQQTCLHWIHRADPGRDLHDHPRSFLSLVLRGGYTEDRPATPGRPWVRGPNGRWKLRLASTVRRAGFWAFRRASDAHRIASVRSGTLTLVLWGPRRRDWGFVTPYGWRHWRSYLEIGEEQSS